MIPDPLFDSLHAEGPAPDRAGPMRLYGQFVGSWEGRVVDHQSGAPPREAPCEVHFGWVLEGRAVQDVWIVPPRNGRRAAAAPTRRNLYGTTLRVYDPQRDLWHITWINPPTQAFNTMTGRQVGDDIVQDYRTEAGALVQWLFTEIRPDSFHWIGRDSMDGGTTWNVRTEFFLRRKVA